MLAIRENGDPVLRTIAIEIPPEMFGSPGLAQILRDMEETLGNEPDGVALAAPQVGISLRIFIVRYDRMRDPGEVTPGGEPDIGIFINPKFLKSSRKRSEMQEGCLSVRGVYGATMRHERATVRAQNEQGEWFTRGAGGILAQAYQHETDHLDGILFIDHAEELHEQGPEISHGAE